MFPFPFPVYNIIVYHELHASGQFETMTRNVDEEEHSIEMHLPYVAKVMERWGRAEEREEWCITLSWEAPTSMLPSTDD